MGKDAVWKKFFSDNRRYADIINGIGCCGNQVVHADDLQELDTQTGRDARIRDMVQKTAVYKGKRIDQSEVLF